MSGVNSAISIENEPRDKSLLDQSDQLLSENRTIDDVLKELPISADTACGIGFIHGPNLQRFANGTAYVILYSVLGNVFAASHSYFNATITTIEKRLKIPSRTTGLIVIGTDITELFGFIYCYCAGRGHRPRWIAFGIYLVVLFCCLTMLPHFLYGPGEDALQLTKEYGSVVANSSSSLGVGDEVRKFLCRTDADHTDECIKSDGNFASPLILFVAHLVRGVGNSLFMVLGVSYMDDNIEKSSAPALLSFSYFLRLLGPVAGFHLASYTLKLYIDPTLTPIITDEDPRWLGAWWLGWIPFAILLFISGNAVGLFPMILPRTAARKILALEQKTTESEGKLLSQKDSSVNVRYDQEAMKVSCKGQAKLGESEEASLKDMLRTLRRLLTNKTLMVNNVATVFYFLGATPHDMFMPKYMETLYHQSPSDVSFITGTVGLVCTALGILLAGLVISKFKPRARHLAAWNVIVASFSALIIFSWLFLGCPAAEKQAVMLDVSATSSSCNENCNCDYIEYSPVCSENGRTFISACHAGCRTFKAKAGEIEMYSNCSCIKRNRQLAAAEAPEKHFDEFGTATPGPCSVDCKFMFYLFLGTSCFMWFLTAGGRASNFLVTVRCVDETDKPTAIAIGITTIGLLAFIPGPIIYGYILDSTCIIWGKTCEGTGNCWVYDAKSLRYILNLTASGFVLIGTVFDIAVWYLVKDLQIFDEEYSLKAITE